MQLSSRTQTKISAVCTAAVIAANAVRAEPALPAEEPAPAPDGLTLLGQTNLPPHAGISVDWMKRTHTQTVADLKAAGQLYSALPAEQRQGELSSVNFSNRLAAIKGLWNRAAETTEAMREHCATMPDSHRHYNAAPLALDAPFNLAAQGAGRLKAELSSFSENTANLSNRVAEASGILNPQRETLAGKMLQEIDQATAAGNMHKAVRDKAVLELMLEKASIAKGTLWVSGVLAGLTSLFVAARPFRKLWEAEGYAEFGKEYLAGKKGALSKLMAAMDLTAFSKRYDDDSAIPYLVPALAVGGAASFGGYYLLGTAGLASTGIGLAGLIGGMVALGIYESVRSAKVEKAYSAWQKKRWESEKAHNAEAKER